MPATSLLLVAATAERAARDVVATAGDVFATFDAAVQDSGNVSYGVATPAGRFFVKTAGDPADDRPLLGFDGRVALLRNAARLHRDVRHPALVPLRNVVETATGPALVYDWVDGELLWTPADRRDDPTSAPARFRALPRHEAIAALDAVLDLHATLADAGWIAGDFYDGSLMYDFTRRAMHVVDLDSYHHGPTTNTMGPMFGSSRYMAPEEHVLGAAIDERTTVFNLGRMLGELLGGGFVAQEVVERATRMEPRERHPSVRALLAAWRTATR